MLVLRVESDSLFPEKSIVDLTTSDLLLKQLHVKVKAIFAAETVWGYENVCRFWMFEPGFEMVTAIAGTLGVKNSA